MLSGKRCGGPQRHTLPPCVAGVEGRCSLAEGGTKGGMYGGRLEVRQHSANGSRTSLRWPNHARGVQPSREPSSCKASKSKSTYLDYEGCAAEAWTEGGSRH